MCHSPTDRPPHPDNRALTGQQLQENARWYRDQLSRLRQMNDRLRRSNAVLIREKGALQAQAERDELFITEQAEAITELKRGQAPTPEVYAERDYYRRRAECLSQRLGVVRDELSTTRSQAQHEVDGYRRDVRELRRALATAEEYAAKANEHIETLTSRLDAVKEVASL